MERALRQTVAIGAEGRVEITRTELVPVDRKALVDKLQALRDQAIADGMETWDIDRINAEIAQRRVGGYWPDPCDPS